MAAVRFLAPRHEVPALVAPFPSGAALNAIDPAAAPPLPPQKPVVASATPPAPAATALAAVPRPVDLKRRTIAQAQRDLARLGYPIGTFDGVIGWKTRAAIRAFQTANGLAVDGELTPELAKALRAARRQ
jgi:peptidoglycan hydrolase-like protein with peptidoglycan-binding domain